MSLSSGFFNSVNHDRLYNADEMSRLFDGLIRDGVFASIGTCFVVTQNAGMVVNVGVGRAWFDHTWTFNDAILPITIDQSEMLVPRIDAVVIEVNHDESVRLNSIKVVKGTPGSNPVKPTLTKDKLVTQYPLCYVTVGAAVEEIRQADIENTVGTTECPFVSGILEVISIEQLIPQWKDILNKFVEDNTKAFSEWMNSEKEEYEKWAQENKDSYADFVEAEEAKYKEWFDAIQEAYNVNWAAFTAWESTSKKEFEDWFAGIKSQLSGDIAGNLLNRINELQDDKVGLIKMGYLPDELCYRATGTIDSPILLAKAPSSGKAYTIVSIGPKLLTADVTELQHTDYKYATCENVQGSEINNVLKPFDIIDPDNDGSGITCTKNDDGTYTLNGTSGEHGDNFYGVITEKLTPGTYKFVGTYPDMATSCACGIAFVKNDDTSSGDYKLVSDAAYGDNGNGVIFTTPEDYDAYMIMFEVKANTTINNVVFKPMITSATNVTYDDFVSYDDSPKVGPITTRLTFGNLAESGSKFDLLSKANLETGCDYELICFLSPSIKTSAVSIGVKGDTFENLVTPEALGLYGKERYTFDFVFDGGKTLDFVCLSTDVLTDVTIDISQMTIIRKGVAKENYGLYTHSSEVLITPGMEFPVFGLLAYKGETTVNAPFESTMYYVDGENGKHLLEAIKRSAESGGVSYGPDQPINPREGDIWIDDSKNILKIWNGSAWVTPMADDVYGSDIVKSNTKPSRNRSTLWIDTANSNEMKHVDENGTVTALAAGGVSVGATAPTNTKLLWIDTGNGGIAKYWNGSAWTATKAVWG
mgnify:CR=1 FL=1